MTLTPPSTTRHVSASPHCPCTPRLHLSLLRPLSDASPLPPRSSPRHLAWNLCRRHSPCPSLLTNATKARPLDTGHPAPCASSSTFRPMLLNRIRTLLDSHMSCFGLIRSLLCTFPYRSFVLDSPPPFASCLVHAFAIGLRSTPFLSTLRSLSRIDIPFILARSFYSPDSFSHTTPRGLSPAERSFLSSPLSPFTRSFA